MAISRPREFTAQRRTGPRGRGGNGPAPSQQQHTAHAEETAEFRSQIPPHTPGVLCRCRHVRWGSAECFSCFALPFSHLKTPAGCGPVWQWTPARPPGLLGRGPYFLGAVGRGRGALLAALPGAGVQRAKSPPAKSAFSPMRTLRGRHPEQGGCNSTERLLATPAAGGLTCLSEVPALASEIASVQSRRSRPPHPPPAA